MKRLLGGIMIAAGTTPTLCGFTAARSGIQALTPALAGASSTGQTLSRSALAMARSRAEPCALNTMPLKPSSGAPP